MCFPAPDLLFFVVRLGAEAEDEDTYRAQDGYTEEASSGDRQLELPFFSKRT